MTPISTGRNRKYFCVAGSFTTKLASPRKTCSTIVRSGRRRGPLLVAVDRATELIAFACSRRGSPYRVATAVRMTRSPGDSPLTTSTRPPPTSAPTVTERSAVRPFCITRTYPSGEKAAGARELQHDLPRSAGGIERGRRMHHGRPRCGSGNARNGRLIAYVYGGGSAFQYTHAREPRAR